MEPICAIKYLYKTLYHFEREFRNCFEFIVC